MLFEYVLFVYTGPWSNMVFFFIANFKNRERVVFINLINTISTRYETVCVGTLRFFFFIYMGRSIVNILLTAYLPDISIADWIRRSKKSAALQLTDNRMRVNRRFILRRKILYDLRLRSIRLHHLNNERENYRDPIWNMQNMFEYLTKCFKSV